MSPTSPRIPLIAGNWKMHKALPEARSVCSRLRERLDSLTEVEVAVCPPAVFLPAVADILRGSTIRWGAQNVYWEKEGAFTGELSAPMLASVGCTYVIVGHSERRHIFGETDDQVNRKVKAVLQAGLSPIMCVGETLDEREAGRTEGVVKRQLASGLEGMSADDVAKMVIAYEPVWAIGTGHNATGEEANRVIKLVRAEIAHLYNREVAEGVRIQYGGSVKPGNIDDFMTYPDIDGALVGGASLDPVSFSEIVSKAKACRQS